MRWLYHLIGKGDWNGGDLHPPSLRSEGFVHCSYRDAVAESAARYFPAGADVEVLRIDPRRLPHPVLEDPTPRGPMPHVYGAIPGDAVRARIALSEVEGSPDAVLGAHVALLAFEGMTLLDLVGVWDPLSRIASMGFDATHRCEVVGISGPRVYQADGARIEVARVRPDLDEFDVLVVPGGRGTRLLEQDPEVLAWLSGYPRNRLLASVCTGALLLGATGRLRGLRATTHHLALGELARHGAEAVRQRVVDCGQTLTAAGVSSGLDLGIHLARRLMGDEVADRIAEQMEWPGRPR